MYIKTFGMNKNAQKLLKIKRKRQSSQKHSKLIGIFRIEHIPDRVVLKARSIMTKKKIEFNY